MPSWASNTRSWVCAEARATALHETRDDAGITRTRPIAGGLVLPADGTARLAPGRDAPDYGATIRVILTQGLELMFQGSTF